MSDWTELLPEGVENPIVVEVRHPKNWRADKAADDTTVAEIQDLVDDADYRQSLDAMLAEVGGDHFTLLAVEQEDGQNRAHLEVHLPPSVPKNEQGRASATVIRWLKSSKLGDILWGVGRRHGMEEETSGASGYKHVKDLGRIKKREEVGANIRPKGRRQ